MKTYIKPNTELHEIELQQMIALGSNPEDEVSNQAQLGKRNSWSTDDSQWDEEE